MKVKILSVSLSPLAYDFGEICNLSYDEAKEYFEKDEIRCCNVREFVVDQTKENEMRFHADGMPTDASDTMLNWMKVTND